MMEAGLLTPCNYYCGNCIMYKKSKCLGCSKATEKASAEGRIFCDIAVCAKDKKMLTCSDCKGYPCEKYDKSIFSESFIKWIRDKLKEP
ncbi:MAG: DUF3795 domain-containing protein [Candidatus Bathyarchaeia archaeon]